MRAPPLNGRLGRELKSCNRENDSMQVRPGSLVVAHENNSGVQRTHRRNWMALDKRFIKLVEGALIQGSIPCKDRV